MEKSGSDEKALNTILRTEGRYNIVSYTIQ